MPPVRLAGNVVLSWLTRAASGYWRLFDSQCGYTVASRRALLAIGPERMFARYGYPNDLLARLGAAGARVVDVPVRPVYGPAWRSGLRPARVALPLAWLLLRAFVRRLRARAAAARPACCSSAEEASCEIGLLTTSFPRHAGDYAGSFVGDRVQRLLDEGHTVEVLAAGAAGTPARGRRAAHRPADSRAAGLFYGEGAPEALERGGAIWLGGGAVLWRRSPRRRARARRAGTRSNRTGWSPARSRPPRRRRRLPRRAFAHSGDVALLERIPLGRAIARRLAQRRDRAPLRQRRAAGAVRAPLRRDGRRSALGGSSRSRCLRRSSRRARAPDAALRRRLGLAAPTVLAVGRLVPIKGHAALLHACARARAGTHRRRPEVVILGDGPERARLARLAAALEVPLRLAGAVPRAEVADWLRAADLFAQPSVRLPNGRTEGAPIAAREAHAVGIPVWSTNEVARPRARDWRALRARGRPACNGSVSGV